jgi:hypothetical protein
VAKFAREPLQRSAGLAGVMMSVISMNQMFGDMGIFAPVNMYMLAIGWAAALRLPIEAGVWPNALPAAPPPPRPDGQEPLVERRA